MSSNNSLQKIDKLLYELAKMRPLKPEIEQRIVQKLCLEWNFHSVTHERNSLTFGETKALILQGNAIGGKPLKDYIEMKIHNDTISWIFEIAGLGFAISDDFIKQIHESILLEPYEVESFDKDGKPILKMVEIGKYKQTPNNTKGTDGRIITFATPEETPKVMRELLDWFSAQRDSENVHPVSLAAEFHYKFVKIQPFDDANGRIAKILTNLILLQFGYPPIVVKSSEKGLYYGALKQADAGVITPFIDFIARSVVSSLELMVKGAKGENIDEIDNLEKDLIVLEQKLRKLGSKIVKREKVVLLDIFDKSLRPLLDKLIENYSKFDRFYINKKLAITITSLTNFGTNGNDEKKSTSAKTIAHLRELLLNEPLDLNPAILITYTYKNLNSDGFGDVDYQNQFIVRFDEMQYLISESNRGKIHSNFVKKYSEELSKNEVTEILNQSSASHKTFIEQKIAGSELSI